MPPKIAVVIPCFNVKHHVLDVIARIGPQVSHIIVVDDGCPAGSGGVVEQSSRDPRVRVLHHDVNRGVGGAMVTGYKEALSLGADICVKIDGDGQMDPAILPRILAPLLNGVADYSKGNRFFFPDDVKSMPFVRILGNAALSFLTKLSSGYWHIFDPTNGYTAIHRLALEQLTLERLDQGFFFESDILFRLYLIGAVVQDVPMRAVYGKEASNLHIGRSLVPFLAKNLRNTFKRIFYRYFLRDLNLASIELTLGTLLLSFGVLYGIVHWVHSVAFNEVATAGTVMLAALPTLLGVQLILGFFAFDYTAIPRVPLIRVFQA